MSRASPATPRWDEAPLGALIDHIVETYHRPLPGMLTRLAAAATAALGATFAAQIDDLKGLLLDHMRREEELVFPWLRRPSPGSAGVLVTLLEREHDDAVRCVRELRQTLADLAAAPRATNDSLTAQLRDLEQALEEHVTLENQVLFPRALAASPETSS